MVQPLEKPDLPARYASLADFREGARRRIPNFAFEYLDGGIGRDVGLQRNYSELDKVMITPRNIDSTQAPQTGVEIFGESYSTPFCVAPVGFIGLFHPRCGPAFAKRSKELGMPFCLSFASSSSTESIIEAMDGTPPWQQFYWPDDEDVQDDIIARMKALGVKVIMPTVDIPGFQWRERTVRAGSSGMPPLHVLVRDIIQRPRWALDMLRGPRPALPNMAPYAKSASVPDCEAFLVERCTRPMGVGEIAKLRDKWDGKLVIKGVMAVEDAVAYTNIGVDGIVVSNHGGRQLDAAPSVAELLPPIAAAVKGKTAIIADSGVASGLDAIRMLRLGADYVMIGRLAFYAAAALGPDGAQVLDLMKLQIKTVMTQLGIRSLDELKDLKMDISN